MTGGDAETALAAELIAVVAAANAVAPRILTVEGGKGLPSGPFESSHRSLQSGLRAWVEERTRHPLGFVEQLYTFADRDRMVGGGRRRTISISYLGLAREAPVAPETGASWQDWYRYFPWEDRREGEPARFRARRPGLERGAFAATLRASL